HGRAQTARGARPARGPPRPGAPPFRTDGCARASPPASHQPPRPQRTAKRWLDDAADGRVRVTDPGDVRLYRQRRGQRRTSFVSHDDAELARDELRAHVVGMTAEWRIGALHERP